MYRSSKSNHLTRSPFTDRASRDRSFSSSRAKSKSLSLSLSLFLLSLCSHSQDKITTRSFLSFSLFLSLSEVCVYIYIYNLSFSLSFSVVRSVSFSPRFEASHRVCAIIVYPCHTSVRYLRGSLVQRMHSPRVDFHDIINTLRILSPPTEFHEHDAPLSLSLSLSSLSVH